MQQGDSSREAELQNLLSDERSRCYQYKQIYQTLKDEHNRVKEELTIIHAQLKEAVEQSNLEKASNESYIKKLEATVKEKHEEINLLNKKISEFNPDEVRKEAHNQERRRFEERLKKIESETDELRTLYNNAHYDKSVLKSQLEFSEKQHARANELLNVQHMSEVSELKAKIDALESENRTPLKDYSVELRAAEKEVLQLHSRIKVLQAECDEVRAENEKLTLQMSNDSQCYGKQLGEQITNIRVLESEKEIISVQKEVLQNEVVKLEQEKSALKNELQIGKQEIFSVRSELEDCKQKYDIDTTNLNIEAQQLRAQYDSLKEQMNGQIDRLKTELTHLTAEFDASQKASVEKEENLRQHILLIKQQAYQKCNEMEQAKEKAEYQLKEIEIAKNEELTDLKQKLENLTKQMQHFLQEKLEAEKEIFILKTKLEACSTRGDKNMYDDLVKQNTEFHKEIELLKGKINQLMLQNAEALELRQSKYSDAVIHSKLNPESSGIVSQELVQLQLTLEQQKYQYQQRIDSLENQIKEQQNTWFNEKKEMQTKLKLYSRLITKLRERFDAQKTRIEEMEVNNDILKLNVPIEDHMKLKEKLCDLQRKQEEFHQIMITALPFAPEKSFDTPIIDAQTSSKILPFSLLKDSVSGSYLQDKIEQTKTSVMRRKSFQQKRSGSRRVADYTSSSDIENL